MEAINNFFAQLIFANPALAFGLAGLIILDLFTGVFKSTKKGVATRSTGMKKSVLKFNTYFSMILLSFILTNVARMAYDLEKYINELGLGVDAICLYLIHLEVKSILENVIIANTDENGVHNEIALFLIPIHNAWILKLKNIREFNYNESKKDIEKKIK